LFHYFNYNIMKRNIIYLNFLCVAFLLFFACSKDDKNMPELPTSVTIEVENVLAGKPLVQSGIFKNLGASPAFMPGESVEIKFYAGIGQTISFVTMYGNSNDLFFAPANPGISVYDVNGEPIEGDVSAQIKLWDNGTRINQAPGSSVVHPGVEEPTIRNISEVNGVDQQGNNYPLAKDLVNATLKYEGNSLFSLTLKNISNTTANQTPLSPGVWAVSYVDGGQPIEPNIFYTVGKPSANGLTNIAEGGDVTFLSTYLATQTGVLTGLSPILVVVYNGTENPIYKVGEKDRGKGLKNIAQMGDGTDLQNYLKTVNGVKDVYLLAMEMTGALLPKSDKREAGKVTQELKVSKGDRIAIVTMYGASNDWFFASRDNGVDAMSKGDISNTIGLFDNGTAVSGFPGANRELGGTQLVENLAIMEVPNPTMFSTLPLVKDFIKVTLK